MRKLALAVAVAMASGKAFALGLGEIKLNSALNEPFNAEIQLITDRPAELEGAVVRLAPQDAFRQAGVEWPAVLSDLKFSVVKEGGATVVKVTSSQPIREPFLDFIVQLQWPAGRLLREYTVLLDPPIFGGEKAAPVTAPVTAPQVNAPRPPLTPTAPAAPADAAPGSSAGKPRSAPSAAATAPRPAQVSAPGTYGPTRRTDTAWAVAQQVRPDSGISIEQAMLALLEANPEAFYGHNVNNLLAGFVLRVPARELMTALPARDAQREVSRQYQQWRQDRSGAAPTAAPLAAAPAAPGPNAAAAPSADKTDQSGRLRLAAPGDSKIPAPGAGGGNIDILRNDLAIALESADAARRENEELRSRLSALEGQIDSMQRLMTLKDGTLSQMQGQAEAPQAPAAPLVTPPASVESAPTAQQPPQAAPQPAAKPAPTEPPQTNDFFADPMLLGALGGGALLLLAVAWLVARRRRAASEDEAQRFEPIVMQAAAEAAAAKQARADNTVEAAMASAESAPMPQVTAVADEVARSAEGLSAQTAGDLDMAHTAEGDIDPIVEADVYLAYRRYQQAEALIQTALAKEPQRLELKVKLLEIHYAARNAEAFESLAEALHNQLWQHPDEALWQRVVAMGAELLPNHVLFSGASPAREQSAMSGAGAAAAGSALFAAGNATAADATSAYAEQDDFFGFDPSKTPVAGQASAAEQSLDLDLNPADAPLTGGDGLDNTVAGTIGEMPDVDAGRDVSPEGAKPMAPERKDETLSWTSEPALSDFGNIDFNLDDTDFLAGTDVVGTKLDLARAYIDMGDHESARDILKEVLTEGNDQQRQEAQTLSQQIA